MAVRGNTGLIKPQRSGRALSEGSCAHWIGLVAGLVIRVGVASPERSRSRTGRRLARKKGRNDHGLVA
eukprot:5121831-Prymnesium_polylepis.1